MALDRLALLLRFRLVLDGRYVGLLGLRLVLCRV